VILVQLVIPESLVLEVHMAIQELLVLLDHIGELPDKLLDVQVNYTSSNSHSMQCKRSVL